MRVVALFRVSTEHQAAEGASLDAQQRRYHELAAQHGWTTVAEFRGHESATMAASDRRVLQQVLACVRDEEPDAIYVHEQSRLTRGDELDAALLMRELKERRIKIVVCGVVRDLASIDERFMIGIQSLVDRAESERIKERMMRGKHEKARRGKKVSGAPPYGYTTPPRGTPGHGTLQIVPEEAHVVRRIFQFCAAGKGDQAIVTELSRMGAKASRGGNWGKTSVHRTLMNPAYVGTCATNVWLDKGRKRSFKFDPGNPKAILVHNAHPAIVDQALWDAVQNRQRLPRTAVPRMLSGLLWVNGMFYHGDSGRRQPFYRAERGLRGHPWLDAKAVDDAVWDAFASLATEPEFVEKLLREGRDPHEQEMVLNEIEYLSDQIKRLQKQLERLIDMRSDGEIDKAEFLAKSDKVRTTIERMKKDHAEQQARAVTLDGSYAARIVKAVQMLIGGRTKLDLDQKSQVVRSIVRRVDVQAVKTGATFSRDAKGHMLPVRNARWAVSKVSFILALREISPAPREVASIGPASQPVQVPSGWIQVPMSAESSATSCDSSRYFAK